MENQTDIKVVTISDLWSIFIRRLWIMILAAALVAGSIFTMDTLAFVPRYESIATLYILQQNNVNEDKAYEDFNLALKVVNDCTHLLKSHSVLDAVIDELNLTISYDTLHNNVTVTNPADTRILEVRVEADSPDNAKMIVDKICEIGTEKISEAMGFEQVNFYEHGILDTTPCNSISIITYVIIGLVVAVVIYSVFLIAYFLDDNIRTDEDIENCLKVSILGDIPNFEDSGKKKYGGRYYRSKYYKRGYYRKRAYGEEKK